MRRWLCGGPNQGGGRYVEHEGVDAFLAEIEAVCVRHKMSISHEDGHGSFVVELHTERNATWLQGANVGNGLAAGARDVDEA